ncbi:MAG TPA: 3-oxoacyl-[acyl-carrier-protein] reductase [Pirellulales bacterium]|jgi:3-oxoacyl-[acyl-carrier protein] reductase|nr:3-oxoacyl-[acyl-carrier-protein] reductase [Pirellulales bacterium]
MTDIFSATGPPPLIVDLNGQSAIVTGASRGIGRAIAQALASAGAQVACVARNAEKLAETVGTIRSRGGVAEAYECDVTDAASVQRTVDAVVEKCGKLHILINNAGITRDTLIPRMSDEDWDLVVDTNLRGTFLFTRAATRPMMQGRYGRIVNIASVSGLTGNPGQANYSASKAGVIGLTRTVARELASRKITVNAVAPGFIETEMTEALGPLVLDEVKKRIPAKRVGQADEIAYAVLFLASAAAAYISGQVLTVDGGLCA